MDIDGQPFGCAEFNTLDDALAAPMPDDASFASLYDGLTGECTHYVRNAGEEWGIVNRIAN